MTDVPVPPFADFAYPCRTLVSVAAAAGEWWAEHPGLRHLESERGTGGL